ncbi:NADP-dependent oxidoreductase, partial [Actinomadura darangshiensis]
MTTIATNHCFRLRKRPVGRVTDTDLELVEETIPSLEAGEALLRTLYLSIDPFNRVCMDEKPSYTEPVPLDGVMRGVGIGQVVESRRSDMAAGDLVLGYTGWQEYAVASGPGEFSPWTVLPSPPPAPIPA